MQCLSSIGRSMCATFPKQSQRIRFIALRDGWFAARIYSTDLDAQWQKLWLQTIDWVWTGLLRFLLGTRNCWPACCLCRWPTGSEFYSVHIPLNRPYFSCRFANVTIWTMQRLRGPSRLVRWRHASNFRSPMVQQLAAHCINRPKRPVSLFAQHGNLLQS